MGRDVWNKTAGYGTLSFLARIDTIKIILRTSYWCAGWGCLNVDFTVLMWVLRRSALVCDWFLFTYAGERATPSRICVCVRPHLDGL